VLVLCEASCSLCSRTMFANLAIEAVVVANLLTQGPCIDTGCVDRPRLADPLHAMPIV